MHLSSDKPPCVTNTDGFTSFQDYTGYPSYDSPVITSFQSPVITAPIQYELRGPLSNNVAPVKTETTEEKASTRRIFSNKSTEASRNENSDTGASSSKAQGIISDIAEPVKYNAAEQQTSSIYAYNGNAGMLYNSSVRDDEVQGVFTGRNETTSFAAKPLGKVTATFHQAYSPQESNEGHENYNSQRNRTENAKQIDNSTGLRNLFTGRSDSSSSTPPFYQPYSPKDRNSVNAINLQNNETRKDENVFNNSTQNEGLTGRGNSSLSTTPPFHQFDSAKEKDKHYVMISRHNEKGSEETGLIEGVRSVFQGRNVSSPFTSHFIEKGNRTAHETDSVNEGNERNSHPLENHPLDGHDYRDEIEKEAVEQEKEADQKAEKESLVQQDDDDDRDLEEDDDVDNYDEHSDDYIAVENTQHTEGKSFKQKFAEGDPASYSFAVSPKVYPGMCPPCRKCQILAISHS